MQTMLRLLIIALGLICGSATMASEVLQRVPQHALGFVIVRNVAQCSEKCEQVMRGMDITFPAPLALARGLTGLSSGLDEGGDLLVAHLPGQSSGGSSIPMVLIPVDDYVDFAAAIHADPAGDICRVMLLGEDILAAQHGSFAMLMNIEDEQQMEQLLARGPRPLPELAPISDWIAEQDITMVLLPRGVQQLSRWRPESVRNARITYDFTFQPSLTSQLLVSMVGRAPRAWLRKHVEIAATGVTVDDQMTARLDQQVILRQNTALHRLAPLTALPSTAELGMSDQPCVLAAGGPLAANWGDALAAWLRQLEVAQAPDTGLDQVSSELWDKEEASFRRLTSDVRSCSIVMLPGQKGEPLMGNFYGVAKVDDTDKYFAGLAEVVGTWNELNKLSTGEPQPEIELVERKIAGNRASEIVLDIATAMADPRVPLIQWMLEVTVGGDGKLRTKLVQVDATTFVFGLATDNQLADAIQKIQQGETTSPANADMQTTFDQLDAQSPWRALIQPQGCLKWAKRIANEYLVLLENSELKLPPIPASPPVGLTIGWQDRRLQCEIVCPAETWQTLGKYYRSVSTQ